MTIKEQNKMDIISKDQSIQDSIIAAYTLAKTKGYDVDLKYDYVGVRVAYIHQNYYGTGPESLLMGDIITEFDGTIITNIDVFREKIDTYYEEYKDVNINDIPKINITILRDNESITLTDCSPYLILNLGLISDHFKGAKINEYYFYDFYNINYNESKPKIKLEDINTVGPSGGLVQSLYIYDCITNSSILNDKYVVGTGTISTDGHVGNIGAILQKLYTADFYLADYFFVPKETRLSYDSNHDDTLDDFVARLNPKFKVYYVDSLEEAIDYLSKEAN